MWWPDDYLERMRLYMQGFERSAADSLAAQERSVWRVESAPASGILVDKEIAALAQKGMISPFIAHQVTRTHRGKVISYGLSSCGYDVRCIPEWKCYGIESAVATVDPKNFQKDWMETIAGDHFDIAPGTHVLTATKEYFKIPRDVYGLVQAKSTYARCGINCLVTPLEPGWEGQITLEFSNSSANWIRLYAHEGIAQVIFFRLSQQPKVTYDKRKGKYQGQRGITLPRMK